jgi:hypothetical protein
MDSYKKSYLLVNAPRTVSVQVRLPHGHIWSFGEVDAFIDNQLRKGDPLPTIGEMKRDGEKVSAAFTTKVKLKTAQLHYAVATGSWQKREWKSVPAEMKDGKVQANLPGDRPLVFYLSVTDDRGLSVSSQHEILEASKVKP